MENCAYLRKNPGYAPERILPMDFKQIASATMIAIIISAQNSHINENKRVSKLLVK